MPPRFRYDIQALRALAVAAVVLYHFWPRLVPGGYVGVDVFFVVSGFLITGLLVRELEETDRIDLLGFYARRIRRLLPAALLVLAATLAVLLLALPPVVWPTNLAQISGAGAYFLNWTLAATQTDYLAADQTPSLVQHYWSLSLEEQFYAVWPLLLVVVVALARPLHIGRRAAVRVALGVLLVVSFVLSVRMTARSPEVAFFLPQARAWEFALGGLVALAPVRRASASTTKVVRALGLGAVVASCLAFSHVTDFPGWLAAVPTAGTALALAAGRHSPGTQPPGVTASCVQWVGDHSYALYLWHWPLVLVLPWLVHRPLGPGDKAGLLVATLVLAWLTKRYVEDPIRLRRVRSRHVVPTLAVAASGTLALLLVSNLTVRHVDVLFRQEAAMALSSLARERPCFGAAAMTDPDCDRPFRRPGERTLAFAGRDYPVALNTCQLAADDPGTPQWCAFGKKRDPRSTVAVVGNSYATGLVPLLQEWADGHGIRILLAARTDCVGLTAAPVPGQRRDNDCVSWSRAVQHRLLRVRDLDLVVFATHPRSAEFVTGRAAPDPEALAQAWRHVAASLREYADAGVATVVVKHPPGPWAGSVPECVAASRDDDDPCAQPRTTVTVDDPLARFASSHPALTTFVSLDPFLCQDLMCHVAIGGVVALFDDTHLTATFARSLARPLTPVLDEVTSGVRQQPSRRG